MKKRNSFFYHVFIFVLAQIFWLMLLGIWIYWYVSNYIIYEKVGDKVSPQILYENVNVFAFVGGLILLVGISFGMSLTFRHLSVQIKIARLYDNFIANVTHELKSPLSSIQLYIETLLSRDVPREKQKEFLELMSKDSERLKKLINSILEIASLDQKKISRNFYIINGETLIRQVINDTAEQYKIPGEKISVIGEGECKIVADYDAIKIVFDNLTDNALKYSAGEIKMEIKFYCDTKKFIVEYKDNGVGISANDQKNIFQKFTRVYNKDIPNVKGTGLGLFWSREIIKSHGGTIKVFSEGKNKGTTFKIELPVYGESKKRLLNKLLKRSSQKNISREDENE